MVEHQRTIMSTFKEHGLLKDIQWRRKDIISRVDGSSHTSKTNGRQDLDMMRQGHSSALDKLYVQRKQNHINESDFDLLSYLQSLWASVYFSGQLKLRLNSQTLPVTVTLYIYNYIYMYIYIYYNMYNIYVYIYMSGDNFKTLFF